MALCQYRAVVVAMIVVVVAPCCPTGAVSATATKTSSSLFSRLAFCSGVDLGEHHRRHHLHHDDDKTPSVATTATFVLPQSKRDRKSRLHLGTFGIGDVLESDDDEEEEEEEDDDEEDVYRERAVSEFENANVETDEDDDEKNNENTTAVQLSSGQAMTRSGGAGARLDETNMDWGVAMESLARRVQDVESGRTGPSQALFGILTQDAPSKAIFDFVQEADPQVVQAMSGAVSNLLGGLSNPLMGMDMIVKANGERLGNLCFQLQMTGYMFRNAEYVVALRKLMKLSAPQVSSMAEYKEAFDRVDADGSGYIETGEIEELLRQVSPSGEAPPAFEVEAFLKFFDSNQDGRISWEEFEQGLGAAMASSATVSRARAAVAQNMLPPTASDEEDEATPLGEPTLSGKIRVKLKSGKVIKIEAKEYLETLKKEAAELKEALRREQGGAGASPEAAAASNPLGSFLGDSGPAAGPPEEEGIAGYIASLQGDVKSLTEGISPEVVETMKLLVRFVIDGGPTGTGRALREKQGDMDDEAWGKVEMEIPGSALQQLALWQLVLGYRLREQEATGEYRKLLE